MFNASRPTPSRRSAVIAKSSTPRSRQRKSDLHSGQVSAPIALESLRGVRKMGARNSGFADASEAEVEVCATWRARPPGPSHPGGSWAHAVRPNKSNFNFVSSVAALVEGTVRTRQMRAGLEEESIGSEVGVALWLGCWASGRVWLSPFDLPCRINRRSPRCRNEPTSAERDQGRPDLERGRRSEEMPECLRSGSSAVVRVLANDGLGIRSDCSCCASAPGMMRGGAGASCSAPATQDCGGCSVVCPAGQRASCTQGSRFGADTPGGWDNARCTCE